MIMKVTDHHRQKPACIYVRQSTMRQVRHHGESTERQYALREMAIELGWSPGSIRILDRDLGVSGTQASGREDFKVLIAEVSLGQVGAVFALEASRLARSCADWHRLIELCSLTGTLIIDEDGLYDPSDFNDRLLLGLKGTMSAAELHMMCVRLRGGTLNKAKKGELRRALPAGLCHDEEGCIVLDPDREVQGAVGLLFSSFRETGTAYAVVRHFARRKLLFPKRINGGAWCGRLVWDRLIHQRVLQVLRNPAYAGAYVYGRFQTTKRIGPDGEIRSSRRTLPESSWAVTIQDHHEGYISWEEFQCNQRILARNRTNEGARLLSGPAREGGALLQGLLLCGRCGRRVTVHYHGCKGAYPMYECTWRVRNGLADQACLHIRCHLLDEAISSRVLEVIKPDQLAIAQEAVRQLEQRDEAVGRQWRMRIERAEYEVQLAERRYEEVDPSNRLVASSLERRWNDALEGVEEIRKQYAEFQNTRAYVVTPEQRERVLLLAQDFPRLWKADTTEMRDRKRMLRLLIKDITVEKLTEARQAVMHIRWQGGACEDLCVDLPVPLSERRGYSPEMVDRVRELAVELSDAAIAEVLNEGGYHSHRGRSFTRGAVSGIRHSYGIPVARSRRQGELSVREVAERFGVTRHVVYSWIKRGLLQPRKTVPGSRCWITIDADKEVELTERVRKSARITQEPSPLSEGVS